MVARKPAISPIFARCVISARAVDGRRAQIKIPSPITMMPVPMSARPSERVVRMWMIRAAPLARGRAAIKSQYLVVLVVP